MFEENRLSQQKSHDYRKVIVFETFRFEKDFHPHESEKPAILNSSSLKSVFDKLNFRDGLVWTEGLTVNMKLRFQVFSSIVCLGPQFISWRDSKLEV